MAYSNYKLHLLLIACLVFVPGDLTDQATNDDIYRLANDIIPFAYELRITPDLKSFTFEGKVDINILVNRPTNVVKLHSKNLFIKNCEITNGPHKLRTKFHLEPTNDLLVVDIFRKLRFNRTFSLSIDFEGKLSEGWQGFMKSEYEIKGVKKWLAVTHFEPNHAREAFPCFDEPGFKARFKIHVGRYTYQKAVSNMPLQNTMKDLNNDKRVWDEFQMTPPISTYLVAFMVSEFAQVFSANKLTSVWVRENAADQVTNALKESEKCLRQMENMTGIPYMLPKLDMVAVPKGLLLSAMENWGMITSKEELLINEHNIASAILKKSSVAIQCHEIAHQWFGDLITPSWWDYLWVKEGFATYYEHFPVAKYKPSWRSEDFFVVFKVQAVLWGDTKIDRCMTTTVKKNSQLQKIYDGISYGKGAAVIRMLEHILSTTTFQKAINNFIIRGRDIYKGTVNQDVFFEALENQVKIDSISLPHKTSISQIMKTWTENTGYPLITVTRNMNTKKIRFEQTTYKTSRATKPQPDQKWIVPLTYTTSSNPQFEDTKPVLWSFAQKTIETSEEFSNTDWILCNLRHSGYYRVNYDLHNWELLITQLMTDYTKIHVINRAQLIGDSFTLAYDGKLSYWVPLQLSLYLRMETDIIPWLSFYFHFMSIFIASSEKLRNSLFSFYVQLLVKNQYERIGFLPKPEDDELTRLARPYILQMACSAGLSQCVKSARKEYEKNKHDISMINQELKAVVLQTVLRYSFDADAISDKLWFLYEKTSNSFDKDAIFMAASFKENRQLLKKILRKFSSHEINEKLKNPSHIMAPFSSNIIEASLSMLLDKVSTTLDFKDEDVSLLESLLTYMEAGAQHEEQLDLLKALKNKIKNFDVPESLIDSMKKIYSSGEQEIIKVNENITKVNGILMDIIVTLRDNVLFTPK